MRWGDRDGRGCSGITCGKAHPSLCPKSLDLRCFDRFCSWRLHTEKCQRPGTNGGWTGVHYGRNRGDTGGSHQNQNGFGRQNDRWFPSGGWSGGRQQNRERGQRGSDQQAWGQRGGGQQGWGQQAGGQYGGEQPDREQWGVGQRSGGGVQQGFVQQGGGQHSGGQQQGGGQLGGAQQAGVLQGQVGGIQQQGGVQMGGIQQTGVHTDVAQPVGGFQGMTAQQPLLGAYRLTGFEQQIQEAVTRAVVIAMTAARGQAGWPAMAEGVPAGAGLGPVLSSN
jgi:hypothetical protein